VVLGKYGADSPGALVRAGEVFGFAGPCMRDGGLGDETSPISSRAHVSGYLAPSKGLIKIYAPEVGTLIEKHAREGQRMKRGDALFVLSTERSSRETPEAQAAAIAQLQH
jgi:multidrug efflux pump subunit AcrA (membrane-fusion protein)